MRKLFGNMKKMVAASLAVVLVGGSMSFSVLGVSATEPMVEEIYAEAIRTLYDSLVEASDNDGVDDFLIDDSYYEKAYDNKIEVARINGTVESKDEIDTVLNDVASRYSMYVSAAVNAFDKDHPEVFWLNGTTACEFGYGASHLGGGRWAYTLYVYLCLKDTVNGAPFDIRAKEYRSEAAIKEAITECDELVKEYMDAVEGKNAYNTVLYFNEQLTKTNQYNTSADLSAIDNDCRECISALKGSIGTTGPVCEGYSRAFKVLCDAAGIPCTLEEGYAFNGQGTEAHMWNYIQMNGNWYAADITWDDPVPSTGGDTTAVSGYENTNYLLVGSETTMDGYGFSQSHMLYNWIFSAGMGLTNAPVLSTTAYDPTAITLATVSGAVTWGKVEDSEEVTIQLIPEGETDAAYTVTTSESTYSVSDVADGTYTLRVSRAKHVTRDYAVTVAGENLTQDVKICLLGDVTGDGKISVSDYIKVLAHAKGTAKLVGYAFSCGDINGGGIAVSDYIKILAHAKGSVFLW